MYSIVMFDHEYQVYKNKKARVRRKHGHTQFNNQNSYTLYISNTMPNIFILLNMTMCI